MHYGRRAGAGGAAPCGGWRDGYTASARPHDNRRPAGRSGTAASSDRRRRKWRRRAALPMIDAAAASRR